MRREQFDAVKFPILEFDYRMDPRARVNLYLRVGRQVMVLGLSAAQNAEPSLPSLGAVEGFVADGKWHSARIDLLAALRRFYPTATTILVEDLAIRSPGWYCAPASAKHLGHELPPSGWWAARRQSRRMQKRW